MSPFVRDVGQILLNNGSTLRELWAGMNAPKDENGSGGSGTTSRHHSISHNTQDESAAGAHSRVFHAPSFGSGGFMLSDDDLATDLGSLSLSKDRSGLLSSAHPLTQPSLLPIYAPVSRSPLSSDWISPYQRINLNIPTGTLFASHQRFGSPSDSGLSAGGSPPRSQLEQQLIDAQYLAGGNNGHGSQQQQQQQQQQSSLTAHFIPGKGIQYHPQGNNDPHLITERLHRVPSHPHCRPPRVVRSNLRRAGFSPSKCNVVRPTHPFQISTISAKACHCRLFQLRGHSTSSSLRPVAPIFST
ncbi:hypothetical protein PISMIDRAFT_686211 [Pisolithus microcarpus 441]|uniref:Uncharacterized protein n=1 Tax=Pisolithus microcarpus 441 TaxID=765257 RepID=A0A0C9Z2I5_9AGAM|nr:hypothetical protein PISMIDRAFT_686211 [Pisolithus microcarpus 441]